MQTSFIGYEDNTASKEAHRQKDKGAKEHLKSNMHFMSFIFFLLHLFYFILFYLSIFFVVSLLECHKTMGVGLFFHVFTKVGINDVGGTREIYTLIFGPPKRFKIV